MTKPVDTLVEIPPPEVPPAGTNWWGLSVVSLAMIAGVVVFASATSPRIPTFEWGPHTGPPEVNLDSLVATDDGFAMLSGMTAEGVVLWTSVDGSGWKSQPLSAAPSQLASIDEGLFAYSVLQGRMIERVGDRWIEAPGVTNFPDEIRARQSSGRPSIIGFGGGMLAMSLFGDVWWSADRVEFDEVVTDPGWGPGSEVELAFDSMCNPPSRTSPDVPPVVETDAGLLALISRNPAEPFGLWPVCEPRVWLSSDGATWTATESTLEGGAYVYDLAVREGVINAVGGYGIGQSAAWTSSDGVNWEPMTQPAVDAGIDLYAIEADSAGWVILGRQTEGSGTVGWTSVDGVCWEELPWQVGGLATAIEDEHLLILDRTSYPEIWRASVTGGSGSCR